VTIIDTLFPDLGQEKRALAVLPPINRARFHYLYDRRGRRYLDLEQGKGIWAAGYRPQNHTNPLKNLLSRGVTGFQDHRIRGQLARLLRQWGIPGHISRFQSPGALRRALESLGFPENTVLGGGVNLLLPWRRVVVQSPWTLILMPCGGRPLAALVGSEEWTPRGMGCEDWTVMEEAWFLSDLVIWKKTQRQEGFFTGLEEFLSEQAGVFYFRRRLADPLEWAQKAREAGFYLDPTGPIFAPGWYSPGEKAAFHQLIQESPWTS
jgi:hypothetical protein